VLVSLLEISEIVEPPAPGGQPQRLKLAASVAASSAKRLILPGDQSAAHPLGPDVADGTPGLGEGCGQRRSRQVEPGKLQRLTPDVCVLTNHMASYGMGRAQVRPIPIPVLARASPAYGGAVTRSG
jgi:hypothetical protein